ncbi:hypothetical protein AN643_01465 [Candidatus Epulonipiscioides saccharophilum]|nr:hypothetical protein AN643_01465 [Epulopiscium sp. SCG-B10WGA-EpuloB]
MYKKIKIIHDYETQYIRALSLEKKWYDGRKRNLRKSLLSYMYNEIEIIHNYEIQYIRALSLETSGMMVENEILGKAYYPICITK